MILLGSKMLEKARSVLLVFAGVLIVSGFKLLSEGEGEGEMKRCVFNEMH